MLFNGSNMCENYSCICFCADSNKKERYLQFQIHNNINITLFPITHICCELILLLTIQRWHICWSYYCPCRLLTISGDLVGVTLCLRMSFTLLLPCMPLENWIQFLYTIAFSFYIYIFSFWLGGQEVGTDCISSLSFPVICLVRTIGIISTHFILLNFKRLFSFFRLAKLNGWGLYTVHFCLAVIYYLLTYHQKVITCFLKW